MLEVIKALGPLYTFLVVLVLCLTLLGVISRIVMAYEKRRETQRQETVADQQEE